MRINVTRMYLWSLMTATSEVTFITPPQSRVMPSQNSAELDRIPWDPSVSIVLKSIKMNYLCIWLEIVHLLAF